MDKNRQRGQFCQSCGMPMNNPGDFGTDIDGSKNEDYCAYCYQRGRFTDPDITMEQMIEKCMGMARQMHIPEDQVRQVIPMLKRWKKRS